jgi:hypothetical protein
LVASLDSDISGSVYLTKVADPTGDRFQQSLQRISKGNTPQISLELVSKLREVAINQCITKILSLNHNHQHQIPHIPPQIRALIYRQSFHHLLTPYGHSVHIHHSLSNSVRACPHNLLNGNSCLVLLVNSKDSRTNTLVAAEFASWKFGHELKHH